MTFGRVVLNLVLRVVLSLFSLTYSVTDRNSGFILTIK